MIKLEIPLTAIVSAVCYWAGGMPLLLVWIGAWITWKLVAKKRSGTKFRDILAPPPSNFESPQSRTAPLWNAAIRYDRDGTAINSLTPMPEPRVKGDLLRLWITGVLISAALLAIGWILHKGAS